MKNEYTKEDCIKDTTMHINQVREFMLHAAIKLLTRAILHDKTKLESPELEIFTKYTPKLRDTTYGSEEYKKFLEEMMPALYHHYTFSSHHPEHYKDGINGMDLFDLIEMICDWKAAVMRHADGNIYESLKINKKRFNIDDQLYSILKNTVDRFNA